MGYKTEPDGTRVYDKGHRYKPLADHERTYRRLKPADAEERGAVRFAGNWYYPLELLPEEQRVRPWTRPDEEAIEHPFGCQCRMCTTVPRVRRLKRARVLKRPAFCPTCQEEPGIVGEPCLSRGDARNPWHDKAERSLTAG